MERFNNDRAIATEALLTAADLSGRLHILPSTRFGLELALRREPLHLGELTRVLERDPMAVLQLFALAGADTVTNDAVPCRIEDCLAGVGRQQLYETFCLREDTFPEKQARVVSFARRAFFLGLSQFVSDYNSAISLLNTQFTFNTSSSSQGVLGDDTTVRTLQSALLGAVSYSALAGSPASGMTLASLGITMQDDGTLSLDSSALNQAVTSEPAAVQEFFQGGSGAGFASTMESELSAFSDPSTGSLGLDINNLTQQYNDLQSDVDNYQSGYIASQQTLLTNMYSQAEIALQSLPNTMKQIQAELSSNSGS